MTFRAGAGISQEESGFAAGRAATREAAAALAGSEPRLAFVLATMRYDHAQVLEGVRSLTQTTPLIGGATSLLLAARGACAHGVAVLLLAADDLTCTVGYDTLAGSGRSSASSLAGQLLANTDPHLRRAVLTLAHPRPGLSARWLQPLQHLLGAGTPLTGATLASEPQQTPAAIYCHEQAAANGAVAALLCGNLQIGTGAAHGWHPIGAPRQATRADGCLVHTINGVPAATLYRDYFGQTAVDQATGEILPRMAVTYPLGITDTARATLPLIRGVQRITADGSLECLAEVPEGAWVRLMIASRQSIIEAATRAASVAISRLRQVGCALLLESSARHRVLGRQATAEFAAVQQVLGAQVPLVGALTQAEAVPQPRGGRRLEVDVQNDAMLIIAFGY